MNYGLNELDAALHRHRVAQHSARHRSTSGDEATLHRIRKRLIEQGGVDAVDALDRLSTAERALLARRERGL